MTLRSLITGVLCLCAFISYAQVQKLGKVIPQDFNTQQYSIDSNANAIVLADIGSTKFIGNNKSNFSLEFNRLKRVHILNKNGYKAADVEIAIYAQGELEEQLKNLKAVTYNLEDGKVVETKLDTKSAVFKEKVSKKKVIKKFTFPNIKEGSIIEFQYELRSDFIFNLQPWNFQGEYPCLWSEYTVSMPEFYKYLSLTQGYQRYFISDQKDKMSTFNIVEENGMQSNNYITVKAGVTDFHWVMKDVPALVEESYTTTIWNYISRIEFQLSALAAPFTPKSVLGNWDEASADLLKDEDFGASLNIFNGWMSDAISEATKNKQTDLDKARGIYTYLRDNMSCTNHNRKYLDKPIREVLKSKNGSVAEINLLLTGMLLKAGLDAKPMILSTRPNGHAYAPYPLIDRFNYVITKLRVDDRDYFLDASYPLLGFNQLQYDAYNGEARVIAEQTVAINLTSDSLKETSLTIINVANDKEGNFIGSLQQTPGINESYSMRNYVKNHGAEQLFSKQRKNYVGEVEISNTGIDHLDKYGESLTLHYDFTIKNPHENLVYLNPMFSEGIKENPFKTPVRTYPVEMPYCIDETYVLKLDVPEGYTIDELPKSLTAKLNDNGDAVFEYAISESGNVISLRTHILFKRSNFNPNEYSTLREFYNMIVKKENEQIVFKKKN